jgi:hypothetical protein
MLFSVCHALLSVLCSAQCVMICSVCYALLSVLCSAQDVNFAVLSVLCSAQNVIMFCSVCCACSAKNANSVFSVCFAQLRVFGSVQKCSAKWVISSDQCVCSVQNVNCALLSVLYVCSKYLALLRVLCFVHCVMLGVLCSAHYVVLSSVCCALLNVNALLLYIVPYDIKLRKIFIIQYVQILGSLL